MPSEQRVVKLPTPDDFARMADSQRREADSWVGISSIAAEFEIPLTTLRRYLQQHERFVRMRRFGKRVVVAKDDLKVIECIRTLYLAGATTDEVDENLMAAHPERVSTATPEVSSVERVQNSERARTVERTKPAATMPVPPTIPVTPAAKPADVSKGVAAAIAPNTPAISGTDAPLVLTDVVPEIVSQMVDMQIQVSALTDSVSKMREGIDGRDRLIREILGAIVRIIGMQENERQLAETERDRQTERDHQKVMISLQELLTRSRRKWFVR